eukprot:TRINITY_DN5804_c0_g1_i1.p1 TRINITY_DN5804_c0_g1~~TRINITY_DN5804_c0_g1_i1.p1  ORF type:complete len:240 (+),score=51.87 TRINITY_DN5804_c0_g1_i1:72-791(+)
MSTRDNTLHINIVLQGSAVRQISIRDGLLRDLIVPILVALGCDQITVISASAKTPETLVLLQLDKSLMTQGIGDNSNITICTTKPITQDMLETIDIASHFRVFYQIPKLESYLMKRGEKGVTKSWKRRFFRLEGRKITYYETAESLTPIKDIDILQIQYICVSRDYSSVPRESMRCVFQITIPDRTYFLLAESESEKELWLSKLSEYHKVLVHAYGSPAGGATWDEPVVSVKTQPGPSS